MGSPASPRPRVLAVDDDPGVLAALHLILDDDHEVSEARDGDDALAMIRASEPDVVLLDLLLDGMDGISVLQTLRSEGRDVPVVIVSGINRAAPAATAGRLGAVDYVTKPFDEADLLDAVQAALRRGADVAALRSAVHVPHLLLIGCPVGVAGALSVALAAHARVECLPALPDDPASTPGGGLDVVVVDIDSVSAGGDAVAAISAYFPLAGVVVLGSTTRCAELAGIERATATILLKPVSARALLEAIKRELSPAAQRLPAFSPAVAGIIDHVSRHFARLRPEALGQELGKTPYYLSRLIRAETGMSLKTYVTRVRLEIARQALLGGRDKIETIASMVGFHDGSHLSRAFVKHLGRRPSRERRPSP